MLDSELIQSLSPTAKPSAVVPTPLAMVFNKFCLLFDSVYKGWIPQKQHWLRFFSCSFQSMVHRTLWGVPEDLSRGPQGQNCFHSYVIYFFHFHCLTSVRVFQCGFPEAISHRMMSLLWQRMECTKQIWENNYCLSQPSRDLQQGRTMLLSFYFFFFGKYGHIS